MHGVALLRLPPPTYHHALPTGTRRRLHGLPGVGYLLLKGLHGRQHLHLPTLRQVMRYSLT